MISFKFISMGTTNPGAPTKACQLGQPYKFQCLKKLRVDFIHLRAPEKLLNHLSDLGMVMGDSSSLSSTEDLSMGLRKSSKNSSWQ